MSTIPIKIDGIGTRKDGAGGESKNLANPKQIRRFFASEAITKGNVVALDFAATEPTHGYGNHVLIADSGDALNMHGIGIALETAASGDIFRVQVHGYCNVAMCSTDTLSDSNEGMLVCQQNAPGELELYDTSAAPAAGGDTLPLGILIEYGTDATADSEVYLLNPANL
jgi:hypothetical protein